MLINKLLTNLRALSLGTAALAIPIAPVCAQTAEINDADGVELISLLSLSWDSDFCILTLDSDDPLGCGGPDCDLELSACLSLLELDGRFYPLTGIMNRNMAGVWSTAADASVGNCRRVDSSPLPPLDAPAIIMNSQDINLSALNHIEIAPTDYGARIVMTSTVGDVICDGEVLEPPPFLFMDGFEN